MRRFLSSHANLSPSDPCSRVRSFPRARIVYEKLACRSIVCADARLRSGPAAAMIAARFELSDRTFVIRSDEHYSDKSKPPRPTYKNVLPESQDAVPRSAERWPCKARIALNRLGKGS